MALFVNKLGLGMHVIEDGPGSRHFQVVMFDQDFVQVRKITWDHWRRCWDTVSSNQEDCYRLHTRVEFLASYHR